MLPSASLGARDNHGKQPAMYEPVHGSAPDIAGQDKANPIAMILSFAMALRYSFDMPNYADIIETAIKSILAQNIRTGDIANKESTIVGTQQMGDLIVAEMMNAKI
jgi:3-isopropylmalate dehydrogenase